MMIDSVVWAQYIKCDRYTDRHVAIANVAPTHCDGRQNTHKKANVNKQFISDNF